MSRTKGTQEDLVKARDRVDTLQEELEDIKEKKRRG
jgi:uncharacterized LabA/DUF88 family protein